MKALSIRQPWAWMILNAIEGALMLDLHASHTEALMNVPSLKRLERGGIIGSVEIVDCVRGKRSAWHAEGQFGFVLRNAKPLPFRPCTGRLGFFEVPA